MNGKRCVDRDNFVGRSKCGNRVEYYNGLVAQEVVCAIEYG